VVDRLAANGRPAGPQDRCLGRAEEAEAVVQEILKIEPDLTLAKLRARTMFLEDSYWSCFSEGLRDAGLPE
jgi:hypothetical protein